MLNYTKTYDNKVSAVFSAAKFPICLNSIQFNEVYKYFWFPGLCSSFQHSIWQKARVTVWVELEEPSLTAQVLYMQDNITGWGLDRQPGYTDVRAH